jgi:hypothetical protein
MGQVDDLAEADGVQVLSYQQAKEKALALFRKAKKRTRLAEEGEPLPEGDWTVRDVLIHYIEDARRTRKDPATAENDLKAAEANILPELGPIPIAKLTGARIRQWRDALSQRGRRKTGWRRAPGDPIEFHPLDLEDKDVLKRRKSSVNRDLSLLKSALNFAVRVGRIDAEHIPWVLVEPFRGVKGRRLRFLSPEEQRKLVMGCSPEFRTLVQGALYTGARWIFLTEEGEAFFRAVPAVFPAGRRSPAFPLGTSGGARFVRSDHPDLGHVDTRMVEEHYGHLAQKTKRDMIRTHGLRLGLGQVD